MVFFKVTSFTLEMGQCHVILVLGLLFSDCLFDYSALKASVTGSETSVMIDRPLISAIHRGSFGQNLSRTVSSLFHTQHVQFRMRTGCTT